MSEADLQKSVFSFYHDMGPWVPGIELGPSLLAPSTFIHSLSHRTFVNCMLLESIEVVSSLFFPWSDSKIAYSQASRDEWSGIWKPDKTAYAPGPFVLPGTLH